MTSRTTLARFIVEEQRRAPGATGEFSALLLDLATALEEIAALVSRGALAGLPCVAPAVGVGERERCLAALANDLLLRACEWGGQLTAMASRASDAPYPVPSAYPRGKYLLVFDPLDGASNLDVDITVGTVFSVLRLREGADGGPEAFLQPGARQ